MQWYIFFVVFFVCCVKVIKEVNSYGEKEDNKELMVYKLQLDKLLYRKEYDLKLIVLFYIIFQIFFVM